MSILNRKRAILALEDGTVFHGYGFGATGETSGEVVFNTSMTGYQEILTDPSYAGQIVTMTYPLIGNYGVNRADYESKRPFVEGFIVREASAIYSSWRAEGSLQEFLAEYGIVGIEGVDTRALTKHIRSVGAMRGIISVSDIDATDAIEKAKSVPSIVGADLVKDVTVEEPYSWTELTKGKYKVVAFDFGIKMNIIRRLAQAGCDVRVVPASTPAGDVLAMDPDGIFLSNGPGDPAAVAYAIETIRMLIGKKPIFGICLGHQLLSLAIGGETYKLKFGHRGGNQPVKNLLNGQVEITSQNHGFAVDPASLAVEEKPWQVGQTVLLGGWSGKSDFGAVEITHINLNDGTVEGLRCLEVPAFSVQYHPEASPGPHDAQYLFDQFIEMMEGKEEPEVRSQ
ncbi:MAG TPA: glutamine-hydrolyzing carbamoyl-phosphate synthase small subunit [Anaerolineae bacterium]|nr:glutamine-hydrolyzing carbamoyl-phosphate synthase small subunit [Anaerolineae bacterium]